MTPLRQVVHVLRKDVREHRVRVAVFLALVTAALGRAMGIPFPLGSSLLSFLTFLTGLAIVGAPIDGDPPTDPRGAWASRPLSPWAVLGAKLAFAVLLVLVAAAAQAIAVTSFDLSLAAGARYVTGPMQLFALVLLATMVVIAATTDLRARLLLVLALIIAIPMSGALLTGAEGPPRWIGPAARVVAAPLMVLALLHFYRRRPTGRAPLAIALGVGLVAAMSGLERGGPTNAPSPRNDVPRADIVMSVPPEAPVVRNGTVRVRIAATQPARGWQYSMQNPMIVVTLDGGRTVTGVADRNFMNLGGDAGPVPILTDGVTAESPAPGTGWREVSIPLGAGRPFQEGDTIRAVTFHGRVDVTANRVVDTIPLVAGGSHTRAGIRTRIDSISPAGRPELVLRAEGLVKPDGSRAFAFTSYFGRSYALLDASGAQVPLQQTWMESGFGGLVLPVGAFGYAVLRLQPFRSTMSPVASSPGIGDRAVSLDGARLLAVEPVPQGSYPVSLEWKRGG